MQQKTFYKTLLEFNSNPAKAKQCLTDKRLTLTEKKILEGYLFIRNNENQLALQLMKQLSPSDLPFVEGQRKFLMALALNNMSFFSEAEKMIAESLKILDHFEAPYFLFGGNFLLFTIYSNQGRFDLMKQALDRLEAIPVVLEIQKIRLLRCRFDYFSITDAKRAKEILKDIECIKNEMSEGDIISHLVCEFMFFVQCDELNHCEKILNEMKKYRKFHLTENFNFMKKLLAHLQTNAPVYFYENDFKAAPLLSLQLKLIHCFEEKNIAGAENTWQELGQLNPESYLPGFHYVGRKCLFSLCLEKHHSKRKDEPVMQNVEELSKLDLLLKLLASSESPLSKGSIYEQLWDEPAQFKEDLKKLTRLISRARAERGIDIKSRKGTYYVDHDEMKRKVG